MSFLSKYNFRTRLLAGFSVLIIFNVVLAVAAFMKIKDTQDNLTLMYNHSLVVSNALREINGAIYAVHNEMEDVLLSKNEEEHKGYLKAIASYDKSIKNNYKVVLDKFLGDLDVVKKAQLLYLDLESIRNEEINLLKQGKRAKALALFNTKGENLLKKLKKQNQIMIDFAKQKADKVYTDNESTEKEAVRYLFILFFILSVLSITVALTISSSISKPIKELISKISIGIDISDKKGSLKTEQELLDIAVIELEKAHEKVKKFNEKLKLEVDIKTKTLNVSKEVLKKTGKELFLKNQFYEKTVQGTPLAFIYFDTNSRVQQWNAAAETIFGYTAKEALGKNIVDLIVPKDIKDEIKEVIEDVFSETGGTIKQNINITKSGKRILCKWHNAEIKDKNNKVIGLTSIVEDITERTKIAQDLQETNKSLQDMVYIASHDLQVPLVSMEGYTEELLKNYKNEIDEEGIYCLTRLQSNAQRMHKLVLSLLDISRLNTHKNPLEEFDVNHSITAIINDLTLLIEERQVKISCDKLPKIHADKQRIESVFRNLIQNAINYGAKNITIGFESDTFFVKDDGIGIPKDQLKRIFEPGERLKQIKAEGVGMGLTFCNKTIALHKGKIWAESEGKNKGTIFKIKFNNNLKI